jgi:hypothetical protein
MDKNGQQVGSMLIVGGIIGFIIGTTIGPSQEDYDNIHDEYVTAIDQCEVVCDDYAAALEDALLNRDDANSQTADAQSYAWSSYDEMGGVLENLYEVDDADDSGTTCL